MRRMKKERGKEKMKVWDSTVSIQTVHLHRACGWGTIWLGASRMTVVVWYVWVGKRWIYRLLKTCVKGRWQNGVWNMSGKGKEVGSKSMTVQRSLKLLVDLPRVPHVIVWSPRLMQFAKFRMPCTALHISFCSLPHFSFPPLLMDILSWIQWY